MFSNVSDVNLLYKMLSLSMLLTAEKGFRNVDKKHPKKNSDLLTDDVRNQSNLFDRKVHHNDSYSRLITKTTSDLDVMNVKQMREN